MKKIIIITLILPFLCFARTGDIVFYSEAVDVFEITDNLSMWHKNSFPQYKNYWKSHLALNSEDERMLSKYAALRKKYYKPVNYSDLENSLFSYPHIPMDAFSNTFYESKSISGALRKLKKHLKAEEIKFLTDFYQHFKSRITKLVKESTLFIEKTKIFNQELKKSRAKKVLGNAAKFLQINKRQQKKNRVYFVWFPSDVNPLETVYQNKVILRYHPLHRLKDLKQVDIIDALIMSYINSLSVNQRSNLSKQFIGACFPNYMTKRFIFEKPLSMALGSLSFKQVNQKKKFNLTQKWSLHPWINTYVKLLYPLVQSQQKNRKNISGDFISNASSICQELEILGSFYKAFQK